jgi:hypothetical protein
LFWFGNAFEKINEFHLNGGPSSRFGLRRAGFAISTACQAKPAQQAKPGGAERDRTADLVNAIHALSQLSYSPVPVRDATCISLGPDTSA